MTAFSDVINAFYHYIEKDVDFFDYFELDEEECMEKPKASENSFPRGEGGPEGVGRGMRAKTFKLV